MLERGEVANSWRRERWDSFRLLTPNWLTRLPGQSYSGGDPDGYLATEEVVDFIEGFAKASRAPVRTGVNVTSVRRAGDGYRVIAGEAEIACRSVVIASGACNLPSVPAFASGVPEPVTQLTPFDYRSPDELPEGGVLVVGASATGVQLAAEIQRSGRPVTLSVGEHVRMPRLYRGRDILWWMDAAGVWDQRFDEIEDLDRARRLPSPQLVGSPERATLDLNTLASAGVELTGRWATVRDGRALFSGGLRNVFSLADLKLERLLDTFDEWARERDRDRELGAPERFEPTRVPDAKRLHLDLRDGPVRTVLWATGFRPDYRWLDVPVLDDKGRLRHAGGVTDSPGLYVLGLPVLRRRRSTFLCGIESDASEVIAHLADCLLPAPAAGYCRCMREENDVWAVMSTARTIRRFTEEPVGDEVLNRCLQAAVWAPSGANTQERRFVVLRSPEMRAVVAKAAAHALTVIEPAYRMTRPADDDDSPRARTNRATYELHDRAGEYTSVLFTQRKYPQASELLLGGSIFPAVQNFLLAARAQGLGACLTSWASYGGEALIREAVGIPEDWMLAGHVVVGWPRGRHGPVRRKPLSQVVFADHWGDPAIRND